MRCLAPRYAFRPMRGMAAFWLTIFVFFLPAVRCHSHDAFISQADDHEHAATDSVHSATFASLPPSTQSGEKLFPYTALIAIPFMVDISPPVQSSNGVGAFTAWLLEATARPRAPPSLKL